MKKYFKNNLIKVLTESKMSVSCSIIQKQRKQIIHHLNLNIMDSNNSNLKETANVYNMEPGTFRVDIFPSTMSFGGYAVSKDGTCVRINKNYKSESYARKVLKAFVGK